MERLRNGPPSRVVRPHRPSVTCLLGRRGSVRWPDLRQSDLLPSTIGLAIHYRSSLAPSAFAHETEITMIGSLHDGLCALQRETGAEALHHSEISVAVE
jgi:hypothetical protein